MKETVATEASSLQPAAAQAVKHPNTPNLVLSMIKSAKYPHKKFLQSASQQLQLQVNIYKKLHPSMSIPKK